MRGATPHPYSQNAPRRPLSRIAAEESQRLLALWKRLQSASPASVLNRGFAYIGVSAGSPIFIGEIAMAADIRIARRDAGKIAEDETIQAVVITGADLPSIGQ